VVTAVLEIVVFVLIAQWIGLAWALAITLATTLLGGWLLRREGVRGWRRFRDAVRDGHPPGRPATDGVLGLTAALLLTAPGFVSDLVGALLLVPPTRHLAGDVVQRLVERRVSPALAGDIFGPRRVKVRRGPATPNVPPPTQPSAAQPLPPVIEGDVLPPASDVDHVKRPG
jgi:UPF0716 protein FxsA